MRMIFGFLVNMGNPIALNSYSTPWALFPQKWCVAPEFFVLISSHCSTQIWRIRYGGSCSIYFLIPLKFLLKIKSQFWKNNANKNDASKNNVALLKPWLFKRLWKNISLLVSFISCLVIVCLFLLSIDSSSTSTIWAVQGTCSTLKHNN